MKVKSRKRSRPPRCKGRLLSITGRTSLYGIIGFPLKHTASPAMQNAVFRLYGMDCLYIPLETEPCFLGDVIRASRALFRGLNVTVPFKKDVIAHLDHVDAAAREMEAVNTIRNRSGRLEGFNTDFLGLRRALRESFSIGMKGKRVCILGAGGASAAALYLAVHEGAKRIIVVNRTIEKARVLAAKINRFGEKIEAVRSASQEAEEAVAGSDVIVNATSLGLGKSDPLPCDPSAFRRGQFVMDMVYNPPLTGFLKAARKRGCRIAGGLDMLVYQGAESFRLWTGKNPPAEVMKRSAKRIIGR